MSVSNSNRPWHALLSHLESIEILETALLGTTIKDESEEIYWDAQHVINR